MLPTQACASHTGPQGCFVHCWNVCVEHCLQLHPICTMCTVPIHEVTAYAHWCRWDNNLPHESFVESSSRARMCYYNHPKSHLYSIMYNPEIILKGVKHRISEVPQTSTQLSHKILLIR